jgi:demethylmenaquinone methyltransferase/2-methoxy-6-polyprenyl-1,4-benzoquinol methylase
MTSGDNGETAQSRFLHKIFTAVPRHYDLINRIMTWGLDGKWRRMAVRECLISRPVRVLDLGCGTGDLAIELVRQAGKNSMVVGVDFNRNMLEIAVKKGIRLDNGGRLSFIYSDTGNMPFLEGYFDSAVISFAFRNLSYDNPMLEQYIAEVLRVLRINGRFIILETSQPKSRFIRKLYHLYMHYFVFWLGYLISGSRKAYRYLVESATNYYSPEELKKVLLEAGFRQVSFHRLLFGVVSIHIAIK